ncbi:MULTISPECIES: hypothetical protein [unclassified Haloferax]|uniref:hypothetical protein n=1 Tax=unclassified Haloferax TaxID=2625095 RepID=UPI0011C01C8B|nr:MULTISPECIES: hypothetical protein [unclassified Haloferax]
MKGLNGHARGWQETETEFNELADGNAEDWLTDRLEARLDDPDEVEAMKNTYERDRETYDRRFILRSTLLAAFVHGGIIHNETDWTIEGRVVFHEEEFGPADLLVAESYEHGSIAILAVVSPEQEDNSYERIQQLCYYIVDNSTAIETRLGTTLNEDKVNGAIALNEVDESSILEDVETADVNGSPNIPISLWMFESSDERLSAVEQDDSNHPLGHVPDGGLGDFLLEGREIANTKHLEEKHFHDSHHEKLYRELRNWLYHNHRGSERRIRDFSYEELTRFLQSGHGQPSNTIVESRATALVDWWQEADVISEVSEPEGFDDDDTVYSIINHGGRADISDIDSEYRDGVKEALIRDNLRKEYLQENKYNSEDT